MTKPTILARVASSFVRGYCQYVPFQRGKWNLRLMARPFLVAHLNEGPWMRVSGVSGLEWELLLHEQKETSTASVFKSLLQPGMTIIDVGSNIGYYSLIAAARVGSSGRVISFEPTPLVVARLRENIELNTLGNVSVIAAAASDTVGACTLYCNPEQDDSEGNSLIQSAVTVGATQIECHQTTLDAETSRLCITKVDLVKIDVEGCEVKVLRGAKRLLSTHAPHLLIEVNPLTLAAGGSSPDELYEELKCNGYDWRIVEQMHWRGVMVLNIHCRPA